MTDYAFDPGPVAAVPIEGGGAYPVRRIFCVGRNYAEHAVEMGDVPDREAPFYFTKSPAALEIAGGTVPYPCGTADYHYETEMIVALGAPVFRADPDSAAAAVFGYAAGFDMTRRDLQQKGKDKRRPWDLGKDAERSAVVAPMRRAVPGEEIAGWPITLDVNGERRQSATLADLIHPVGALVADLSRFYHLGPGDLIFTGTPAGVGPVAEGDRLVGRVGPLPVAELRIGPPE